MGQLVSKISVEHVAQDDHLQEGMCKYVDNFNKWLEEWLNDENFQLADENGADLSHIKDIEVNEHPGMNVEGGITLTEDECSDMIVGEWLDDDDEEAVDQYLNMELIMDVGMNDEWCGWVIKCSRGLDGETVGHAHPDPLFDTCECEIEFTDGAIKKHVANIITENVFAQVDSEGDMHAIMEEITNHWKDDSAAPTWDGMIAQEGCLERPKIAAKGWELLVQWKDRSLSWEKLKDLKVSNLIEVAKHVVANWIANEPAFAWWVPQVPHKWN